MIVCHCTQISDHDIRAAIDWMRTADPQTIITPGKIYHALGKAGRLRRLHATLSGHHARLR